MTDQIQNNSSVCIYREYCVGPRQNKSRLIFSYTIVMYSCSSIMYIRYLTIIMIQYAGGVRIKSLAAPSSLPTFLDIQVSGVMNSALDAWMGVSEIIKIPGWAAAVENAHITTSLPSPRRKRTGSGRGTSTESRETRGAEQGNRGRKWSDTRRPAEIHILIRIQCSDTVQCDTEIR